MSLRYTCWVVRLATILMLAVLLLALWSATAVAGPTGEREPKVEALTVFVAASLSEVVRELSSTFTAQSGVEVNLSFGASSTLARQIEAGAKADVYISANPAWADYLDDAGFLEPDSKSAFLTNSLVFIQPIGNDAEYVLFDSSFDLGAAFEGLIAIGDPQHVPAGQYAAEALAHYAWLEPLSGRLLPCLDVREALRVVEMGEAGLGIVYATDALASSKVRVVGSIPPGSHSTISYTIAICKGANAGANDFYYYCQSKFATPVVSEYGFVQLAVSNATPQFAFSTPVDSSPARTPTADVIWLSLKVALFSALLVLPGALFFGWLLARKQFTAKPLVDGLVHLPLVLPPITTGYLLLLLLGSNSPFGNMLEDVFGLRLAFTWYAAVIAAAVVAFPLAVRSIRVSIEMADEGLEQAASTLGASPIQAFLRVTLPLCLPGIISGTLLAFARSLGEFGATITFAGNIQGETSTIPLAMYTFLQVPGMEGAAMQLVAVSVIISLGALVVSEYLVRKARAGRRGAM